MGETELTARAWCSTSAAAQAPDRPFCAADMTVLPVRSGSVAGLVCRYSVIHLDDGSRATAYREFARVLHAGAPALVAFHTRAADVAPGRP